MRFAQLLLAFVTGIAATTTPVTASGLTPSGPPQFEELFTVTMAIGKDYLFYGPWGEHYTTPIYSFNLTDTSGNLAATLVTPTLDTGVLGKADIYTSEATFTIRWEKDQKLAFFTTAGIGSEKSLTSGTIMRYIRMETDSEYYKSLNTRFLVGRVNFGESTPTFTIFGAS